MLQRARSQNGHRREWKKWKEGKRVLLCYVSDQAVTFFFLTLPNYR